MEDGDKDRRWLAELTVASFISVEDITEGTQLLPMPIPDGFNVLRLTKSFRTKRID
jgi:hypothetical protein